MSDLIDRQTVINVIAKWMLEYGGYGEEHGINALKQAAEEIKALPSAQPYFDITVKIDKAYDDGYEAGYLQGRHDWGDLDG